MTSKAQRAITTTTLPERNEPTTINAHLARANTVFEWALNSHPPLVDHNPVTD